MKKLINQIKKINQGKTTNVANVDWTLRINVNGTEKKEREEWISIFFYMADESGPGNENDINWECVDSNDIYYKEEIGELIKGKNKDLGNWALYLNQNIKSDSELFKAGIPIKSYHNITSVVQNLLLRSFYYQHEM